MTARNDHFAQRLAKLERDNRWLKAACVAGLILVMAAAAPPQDESEKEAGTDESHDVTEIPELPSLGPMPDLPDPHSGPGPGNRVPLHVMPPYRPMPILTEMKMIESGMQSQVPPSQVLIALPKDSHEVELEVKRLIIVDDEGRPCGELSAGGLTFQKPGGKQLVSLSTEDDSGSLLLTNKAGDQARLGGDSEYHLQFDSGPHTPVFLSYGSRGGFLMMGEAKQE